MQDTSNGFIHKLEDGQMVVLSKYKEGCWVASSTRSDGEKANSLIYFNGSNVSAEYFDNTLPVLICKHAGEDSTVPQEQEEDDFFMGKSVAIRDYGIADDKGFSQLAIYDVDKLFAELQILAKKHE